jgi:hypothetical protein
MYWDFFSLWKESLNSDGLQFHQYQQNEQSPLTSNNGIQKDHDIWSWKFIYLYVHTFSCTMHL